MKLLSPAQSPHTCSLHKFIIYIQNNAQSIGTSQTPNTKIHSVVWRFSFSHLQYVEESRLSSTISRQFIRVYVFIRLLAGLIREAGARCVIDIASYFTIMSQAIEYQCSRHVNKSSSFCKFHFKVQSDKNRLSFDSPRSARSLVFDDVN